MVGSLGVRTLKNAMGHTLRWLIVMCISFSAKSQLSNADAPKVIQPKCPPLDRKGLLKIISEAPSKKAELVFFSSWCSDCAVHLKKVSQPEKIIVGTFDKQDRIEKTITKMNIHNRCFMDAGIAKVLKVSTVPTERVVTLDNFILE